MQTPARIGENCFFWRGKGTSLHFVHCASKVASQFGPIRASVAHSYYRQIHAATRRRPRWPPAKESWTAANRSPASDDASGIENRGRYKPALIFLSSRGYGMFLYTTTPITLDFGHDLGGVNLMMIGDDKLDLFALLATTKNTQISPANRRGRRCGRLASG